MPIVDPFETGTTAAPRGIVDPFELKAEAAPAAAPEKAPAPPWRDVPLEAVKNFPSSVGGVIAGQAELAGNVGGYLVPKIAQYGPFAGAAVAADAAKAVYQNPSLLKDIPAGVWHGLVEEYGGDEALRRTIATNPAKVLMDASLLVTGGRAATSRISRAVGEIGRAADVSQPFHEIPPPPAAAPPPIVPPKLTPLQEMYQRAGIDAPRAITGPDWQQQSALNLAKQPTLGGAQIGRAVEDVPVQMAARRGEIADKFGAQRLPANVGADIRSTLEGRATTEAAAAKAQAEAADAAARAQYEGTIAQRTQQTADLEAQSARETAAQVGPAPTTTGMGEHAIDAVRAEHQVLRTRKDALYDDAGSRQGTISDPAVMRIHDVVKNELRREGQRGRVALGPDTTPRAMEMNRAVRDFATWANNRQAAAEARAIADYRAARGYPEGYELSPVEHAAAVRSAERTSVNLQQFEDFRKDLNAIYANVEKPADRRAANRIMQGVDLFQERSMASRQYTGDPDALHAFQRARAANRDLMQRFGYNDRFAEDKIIQRIVRDGPTDHIGPNEVADLLHAKPDKAGRVLDRIFEASGDNPGLAQSIRGGLYEHASRPMEAGTPRTPEAIAKDLTRLTGGAREGLASRIYRPEDINMIRRHATALRTAERARERTGEIAKTTKPTPTEVQTTEAEKVFKDVVGSVKSDEALVQRIHGFMTSAKSPADIRHLAATLKTLPEDLKGNVLNLFIRDLGNGPGGTFSAEQFAQQWSKKVPSDVKHLITGGASGHAKALDNLAEASQAFIETHKKYGNITGSGQTVNLGMLVGKAATVAASAATGNLWYPAGLGAAWLGAVGYSKFLATPAGAASAAKFARQMAKLQANPTAGQAAGTQMAARNMRNTAIGLGIPVTNFPDPRQK